MTTNFSSVDWRRIHHNLKRMILTITIVLLLLFLWLPKPAFAFDTGHHSDVTRDALQNEGFKETPIKIVQVENWLVDYYSNWPIEYYSKLPKIIQSRIPLDTIIDAKKESDKLHFDNLFTTEDISNYWMWLTLNTKEAVKQAVTKEDPLNLLTILGISLHVVQDFYSHSNWVEAHSSSSDGNFYSSPTWFDSPPATRSQLELYTGSYPTLLPKAKELHGKYNDGMNKDSYVCDNWQQAYVSAYAASRQWVNAVHEWVNEVNPTFWSKVQNYSADEKALDQDLKAAYDLSLYVNVSGANGHWKGNGSGSDWYFVAKITDWLTTKDSPFVKEFKKLNSSLGPLVKGLKSDGSEINPPSPTPDSKLIAPQIPLNQKAIIVKTERVEKVEKSSWIDSFVDKLKSLVADSAFYGKINVNGQTFIEAVQRDQAKISPAWTTIKFVPSETAEVPIVYELWDQNLTTTDDTHFNISNKKNGNLDFKFAVSSHENTGDITGIHDSPEKAVTSEGSASDSAKITFYVTERSLK
jgi:hypothetical protein